MCTLTALFGVREDYPLVIAANRDEFYARPARPVERLFDDPVVLGGRDAQAGGTWLGATQAGFFAAVTNQPSFGHRQAATLSRGQLVLDMLQRGTPAGVRKLLAGVVPDDYDDFNLMFGDASELFVAYGRAGERRVFVESVDPGLHVLPNDTLDSPDSPKCARAAALLQPDLHAPWPTLRASLARTLADGHTVAQPPPADAPVFLDDETRRRLSALCVRTPTYGTRSASILALQPGRCAHYAFADGPPDDTDFHDAMPLFG